MSASSHHHHHHHHLITIIIIIIIKLEFDNSCETHLYKNLDHKLH